LDASPQLEDLVSEFRLREVRHIQTHHDRRRHAEPPTCRRARDAEVRGDGHVAGAVDEMSKPVVVALLRASRGRIIGGFLTPLNSSRTDVKSADVTTTRAGKCRMSMGTARLPAEAERDAGS
jgi:hypothetical protein